MDLAAEQFVDGFVDCLADEVPAGDLDSAEDADEGDVGPRRVAPPVDVAPEGLNVERVVSDYVAFADVFDHLGHDVGAEGGGVDLSVADGAVVGHEFHEDEVAAAERGRRIADDKGLERFDLHPAHLPVVTRCLPPPA